MSNPINPFKEFFAKISQDKEWEDDANCRGVLTDIFFDKYNEKYALQVCNRCSVRSQCLELGLSAYAQFGVWGGTTPTQREAIKRDRKLGLKIPSQRKNMNNLKEYRVVWEIDIDAKNPHQAAELVWKRFFNQEKSLDQTSQDGNSANVFTIKDLAEKTEYEIDLSKHL